MESVSLEAVSDCGLPVYYYVKEGPAELQDNRLVFTKIPPRSKFPVKVTVVAWQYGIAGQVQTAEPVEHSFYNEIVSSALSLYFFSFVLNDIKGEVAICYYHNSVNTMKKKLMTCLYICLSVIHVLLKRGSTGGRENLIFWISEPPVIL